MGLRRRIGRNVADSGHASGSEHHIAVRLHGYGPGRRVECRAGGIGFRGHAVAAVVWVEEVDGYGDVARNIGIDHAVKLFVAVYCGDGASGAPGLA